MDRFNGKNRQTGNIRKRCFKRYPLKYSMYKVRVNVPADSGTLGGNQLDATSKFHRGPLKRACLSQQLGRAELVPRRPILPSQD